MSGPPYPHPNPAPGSNAIGKFQIGVSPIGTIPPFDWWQTVMSQYANSTTLTTLISNMFSCLDQTLNMDNLFDLIRNVDTAEGYGLDVWGRIVGVQRILQVQLGTYLGFEGPGGASGDSFNVQPFFNGQALTNNFALVDASFRTLIFAKALSNVSDGSIPSINSLLRSLFPHRGNCFVSDNGGMSMTYRFKFFLTPVELAIVQQSGVIPKPAGVNATILQPPLA